MTSTKPTTKTTTAMTTTASAITAATTSPTQTTSGPGQLLGAEILFECLLREGVEVVFGYPGGTVLPIYDALTRYPQLHHVLTRHEQGAAHMADGYARATGRVGVALATSGPGATNLVTGIATAMMDSSPVVFLTGQVATGAIGSDGFQEADITGVTLPITKHSYLVTDVADLAPAIHEAFHIARSGRPGPVLVDIPKDVQTAAAQLPDSLRVPPRLRPYPVHTEVDAGDIARVLELLGAAKRPLILAGRGVLLSGCLDDLQQLVERCRVPVTLTLLGKGGFPEMHPLCLGMMGMHGTAHANRAIQEADLLLALGMRFDDRVTGNLGSYARTAKKVHVDIDPCELNKIVPVDVAIAGDLRQVLTRLLEEAPAVDHRDWLDTLAQWRRESEDRDLIGREGGQTLRAPQVIHDLWRLTNGDALVVTDVGQHQMWTAQYYRHKRPRSLITSGGMGTMGFGLPAAIGAKLGRPRDEVWVVAGDGGFQMTMSELATARQERLDIKIAVINNGYLGMVRQWQELFFERRYSATPMSGPDLCRLAASYDIPAARVTRRDQVEAAVGRARKHTGGPYLLELVVEPHDVVYPMVPPGGELHAMIRRPTAD